MNYDGLLASIGQAKAPKRTNAWKTITGNKTAFMTWFNSQSSTQEQKLKAAYPQLFAALEAVPASRADGPIPVTLAGYEEEVVEHAPNLVDLDA